MTGNNFALELTVGINDLFTQEQQRIEREVKSLERDFKSMQKTAGDISEFRRMQEGMQQLGREAGTTGDEFQAQERQLQRYADALRRAEINIGNLVEEQRRLARQLKETGEAAKSSRSLIEGQGEFLGNVVGGVAAGGIVLRGTNAIQLERQAALQTGKESTFFSSAVEREWRHRATQQTGATAAQALEARIRASQLGVGETEARVLAEKALGLQRANPNWDTNEIMNALFAGRQGFGASADVTADLLYRISSMGGDRAGDLLDTFNEYSTLMQDAGLSIQQFSAMLLSGAQSGAFNYDKIADGLKESIKARLTDVTQMEALLGTGKKAGELDTLVKDEKMRGAIKSAVGQFRQANETGGDVGAAFTRIMTLVTGLYKTDPRAARNIMERTFGVQFAEDMGQKVIQGIAEGAMNPQEILGDYQGKLAENLAASFSAMERLSKSWDGTVDKFSTAIGDFTETVSPLINALTKGVDWAGEAVEGNPMLAVGSAAALVMGVKLGTSLLLGKLKDTLLGSLGRGVPGGPTPKGGPSKMPSWMTADLPDSSPTSSGGGWKNTLKKLGGKAGWLGALLFGGAQLYEAAQGEAPLAETAAGVTGSLAGGVAGTYVGAALGTAIFPGIGTAAGSVVGGILGSILGEEGLKSLVSWFTGEESPNAANQEMERLLPPEALAPPEAKGGSSAAVPPAIALHQQLAITISPDFANAAELETAIVQALRTSSPELLQEFQATLERVMQSMDFAQGSARH